MKQRHLFITLHTCFPDEFVVCEPSFLLSPLPLPPLLRDGADVDDTAADDGALSLLCFVVDSRSLLKLEAIFSNCSFKFCNRVNHLPCAVICAAMRCNCSRCC